MKIFDLNMYLFCAMNYIIQILYKIAMYLQINIWSSTLLQFSAIGTLRIQSIRCIELEQHSCVHVLYYIKRKISKSL